MNPAFFLSRRRELINTGMISPSEVKDIIALDLMTKIAEAEHAKKIKEKTDTPREYYLTLYSQCLKVVSGEDVEDVLEDYDD